MTLLCKHCDFDFSDQPSTRRLAPAYGAILELSNEINLLKIENYLFLN